MPIDPETILHLERLSGLRLEPTERELLAEQLARIVSYVDQLGKLDTSSIEPCAHAIDLTGPRRPDLPQPSLTRAEALSGSPAGPGEFFVVPLVFDADGGNEEEGSM